MPRKYPPKLALEIEIIGYEKVDVVDIEIDQELAAELAGRVVLEVSAATKRALSVSSGCSFRRSNDGAKKRR